MRFTRFTSKVAIIATCLGAGAFAVLSAPRLHAANTWYVSGSGSDVSGCGVASAPCRTVTYVLNSVPGFAPGDTINVGGVVVDNVVLNHSAVIIGQTADATIRASGSASVIQVAAGVSATLEALTITDGEAAAGGGIHNSGTLIASRLVITANRATGSGAGIYNAGSGTLTMTSSLISHNRVTDNMSGAGGGIENEGVLTATDSTIADNKGGAYGGGLDNFGGVANLARVIIRRNEAASGAGVANANAGVIVAEAVAVIENAASSQGGGIENGSSLTLKNATVSSNRLLGGPGAGMVNNGGTASLAFVTLVSNTISNPQSQDASGLAGFGGSVEMTATVIAYNAAKNCQSAGGIFQSFGYNASSDAHCGFLTEPSDVANAELRLAGLGWSGGTYTHSPLPGSPLIDAVPALLCPTTDQRGITRPQGAGCEVGAHEATPDELVSADLRIEVIRPSEVPANASFEVTLMVTNLGPSPADRPTVTTTLPVSAQFVSAVGTDWACRRTGDIVTCDYQPIQMPVGPANPIRITLISPSKSMLISAQSVVSARSTDPDLSNNTSTASITITHSIYIPVAARP